MWLFSHIVKTMSSEAMQGDSERVASKHDTGSGDDSLSLLRKLFSFGPIIALSIIKFVFFTAVYTLSLLMSPADPFFGLLNFSLLMLEVAVILYNFITSVGTGGGFVPRGWKPADPENEKYLQFCKLCDSFKAPRAHHCRVCKRCVMKMDHHCPWINSCVGHKNHRNFIFFLLSCIVGSLHSLVIICLCLQKAYNWRYYQQREEDLYMQLLMEGLKYPPPGHVSGVLHLTFATTLTAVLAIGLSLGVMIALGVLLYFQMQIVFTNETCIERWINLKADARTNERRAVWVYPYDFGWKGNWKAVFGDSIGDGLVWPVRPGMHEFTLTVEQLFQKMDKKQRQQRYQATRSYSGRYFPVLAFGWAGLRPPLNMDPRLALKAGDEVYVTRWSRYWLYGEIISDGPGDSKKGWFPRLAVIACCRQERKVQ